jgi:hypothetical protein
MRPPKFIAPRWPYDFVKEKQVESLDALALVLQEATAVERAAELALKEHIRLHGCQR